MAHFARNVFSNKIRFKSDSLLPTDTYAIHTYTYVPRQLLSISRRTNLRLNIRARNFKKVRPQPLPSEKVANPWRTLHNGAQVGSRAIKNRPPRFRAWIIPLWANWNCRHDFRIYCELEFVRYARGRNGSCSHTGFARDTQTAKLSA